MQITDALKNLAVKACGSSLEDLTEDQIADLIQHIADNWNGQGGSAGYTLPAATEQELGGVKKAAAVAFTQADATAETCAQAIADIIINLKTSGIMA